MAMMSGTIWPSSSQGSTERFENEAERIFTRYGMRPPVETTWYPISPFGFSART